MMKSEKKNSINQRLEPAGRVLYVIGTPIGNLGDLSPRAKSLLQNVSIIACEDTRRSGQLLHNLKIKAPLFSFHKHNTEKRIPKLINLLAEGKSLALISDAGVPGISDPGENLVLAVRSAGYEVISIPGACAAITALTSSGLPSGRFCFEGFLPCKEKERKERLEAIAKEKRTSILYESPHRIVRLLKELAECCGEKRLIHISRELTKFHEQHIGSNIGSAIRYFEETKPIGEFTIVLGGNINKKEIKYNDNELIKRMERLISIGKSSNEAAKIISQETGQAKRYLYQILHKSYKENSNE